MALAANALTTVETLCAELGIDVPASGSAALKDLERRIAVASSAIEGWCRRSFGLASRTEKVPGYGTDVLRVAVSPVVSIASVTLDGETQEASLYTCAGDDAALGFIRAVSGPWEDTARWQRGGAPELMAGTEAPAYSVTYSAGYVLPKDGTDGTPATLPPEVEEACLLACVNAYANKGRNRSIASESLGGASVSYAAPGADLDAASGLPLASVALLARYRREY